MSSSTEFGVNNSYSDVDGAKLVCSRCLEKKPKSEIVNKGYEQVCKGCDAQ